MLKSLLCSSKDYIRFISFTSPYKFYIAFYTNCLLSCFLKVWQLHFHTFYIGFYLYPMFFVFYMNFSSLFWCKVAQTFCFFNLTKCSSYILLQAVPLKTMWLIVLHEFSMLYPSSNVCDCPPLYQHFHSLFLNSFSQTFLILPPTTVLYIFQWK